MADDHFRDATQKAPARIQRSRAKGWRMPEGAVYVGRGTVFGNPFSVERFGRLQAVALHQVWITTPTAEELGYQDAVASRLNGQRQLVMARLHLLRGHDLCCWCATDQRCHADALLEIANG
jgi:hypothetical protein